MKQLVKERDHFVIKGLIEKPWQAKRHKIQEFCVFVDIALHLINDIVSLPKQRTTRKTKGRHTRLQAIGAGIPCLGHREQQAIGIDVMQFMAATDDILRESAHGLAKIEWNSAGRSFPPGGRKEREWGKGFLSAGLHRPQR